MKLQKTIVGVGTALALGVAGYATWIAIRAHQDLVTLDVRKMDVREVVKKIERQTWETIAVNKDVQGEVTLKVRNAPLRQVLEMLAGQTGSMPSALYPLYKDDRSLENLEKSLRGELDPAAHGWTNLQARGGFPGGPMMMGGPGGPGMFGMAGPGPNTPQPGGRRLSLNIVGKDLDFAVLAFNRFGQARVVPEDGTAATITLSLKEEKIPSAVAQLAKKANRKWTTLYALQPGFRPGPDGMMAAARGPRPEGPGNVGAEGPMRRPFGGGPNITPEQRDEARKRREALDQELRQALPDAERQKLEQADAERQKLMEEMQSLTPEQRRERMMQMNSAQIRQMNVNRLMNSTPEQRSAQSRQMREMRQRMEQGGQGPGDPGSRNGNPPPPAR